MFTQNKGISVFGMTYVPPLQRKYISSGGFLSFFEMLELYLLGKDEQLTFAEDV